MKLGKIFSFLIVFLLAAAFAEAVTVAITPDPAGHNANLVCGVSPAGTYTYKWYRNSALISINSNTAPASYTNIGEIWKCEVWQYLGTTWVKLGEDTVNIINNQPVLASIGNKNTNENQLLTFSVSATDADGDAITYSASGLPSGASFSGTTFSWTPTYDQAGTYTVTFSVSDGMGGSDSETITITVNNVNRAPVLNAISNQVVNENSLLQIGLSATDPDGNSLTYSATGLPSGATLSGSMFAWTPNYNQAGTYTVTFTVSDGSLTDSETITITVNNVNRAPVLASIGDRSVNENQLLTFSISASDPDGNGLTYSATGLPSGASFSGQTFSWTPTYSQSGSYPVTFTVSDGSLTDSETITITVNDVYVPPANNPPTLTNPSIAAGPYYTNDVLTCIGGSASDPEGNPLSYSWMWVRNGMQITGQTTNILNLATAGNGDKGDSIYCRERVCDNQGACSSWMSSNTITVLNSLPIVASATITPDPALDSDNLTCNNGTVSDIDNDAVTLIYNWYNNSVLTAYNTQILSSTATTAGEQWQCGIVPNDGEANGAENLSQIVTIQALALDTENPSVMNVSALPNIINQSQSVVISATVTDNVAVDTVLAEISWDAVSQTIVLTDLDFDNIYNATFTNTSYTDVYTVRIIANDTSGNVNDTETVQFTVQAIPSAGNSTTNITAPLDSSAYNVSDTFIVNVTITAVNGDLTGCTATISFTNGSILTVISGPALLNMGDITDGTAAEVSWTINSTSAGSSDIRVDTICTAGGSSFDVVTGIIVNAPPVDNAPVINSITDLPDPIQVGNFITFNTNVTDNDVTGVNDVWIEIEGTNYSMTVSGIDTWQSVLNTSLFGVGLHNYMVYANDTAGNNALPVGGSFNVTALPPVNNPPNASDDSAVTDEDVSVLINVLANDTDAEGPVTLDIITVAPLNGVAVIESGQIRYTPNANWSGIDTLTYRINDSNGAQDTAVVTINVNPVPDYSVNITSNLYSQSVGLLENAVYIITITNTGDTADSYTLTLQNINGADYTALNESAVSLNPSESHTIMLTLSDSNPGVYNATVTVTSVNTGDITPVIVTTVVTTDTGWIYNSWVNGTFYVSQSTGIFANIDDSIIENSNVSSEVPSEFASEIHIVDSNIVNSTVTDGAGDDYPGEYDVYIVNCTIINSIKHDAYCVNSRIEDSIDPRSRVVDSTITNTEYYNSNISYSTVSDSWLNYSSVDHSTVSNVILDHSIVANNSVVSDSNVTNSEIRDSTVSGSTVDNSTVESSTVTDSTLNNSAVDSSTITDSELVDTTVTDSTVDNSTLTNSTVVNSDLTNINATNSVIYDSILSNMIIIDANITNNILYTGIVITPQGTFNATVNNTLNLSNPAQWPAVNLVASPSSGMETLNVVLTAQISGQLDRNRTITYTWNDGRGNTWTTINDSVESIAYNAGSYTARVTVRDAYGNTATDTVVISVSSIPVSTKKSGGGGGGGSSGLMSTNGETYVLDFTKENPQTIVVGRYDKIKFTYEGTEYLLRFPNLDSHGVEIKFYPVNITKLLAESESSMFNLDNEVENELMIYVNDILRNVTNMTTYDIVEYSANLTLKNLKLPEKKPVIEEEKKPEQKPSVPAEEEPEETGEETDEGLISITGETVATDADPYIGGGISAGIIVLGLLGYFIMRGRKPKIELGSYP